LLAIVWSIISVHNLGLRSLAYQDLSHQRLGG